MSQIFVPVYKEEGGTQHQNPVVQIYNTLQPVSGVNVVKKAVEVLIKWVGAAWVEQSVWSAGTKVATKTTNPATDEFSYLFIPLADYNAVAACCVPSGTGESSGLGTGGGERVQWDSGVVEDPEDAFANSIVVTTLNLNALAPIGVFISGNMQIDWGNGVIYSYNEGDLVLKTFADNEDPIITIYHDDSPTNLTVGDDAGGFRGTIVSIAGDIPPALDTFQTSNNLGALPALPATVKNINISNTALDASELNTFLDSLITNNLSNGSLSMLTNPVQYADLTKINTLKSRGWFVQAYGVYPNL